MIAVRNDNTVKAAFIAHTSDPDLGILKPDGTPTELFLPFRTTAGLIGNLTYLGSLDLENRSDNILLADGQNAVLVVWNKESKVETSSLGSQITQYSVWGEKTELKNSRRASRSRLVRCPLF